MAKTKAKFQEMISHDAWKDPVRTDIRVHCQSEPLLKKTIRTVDLNDGEFNVLFQTMMQQQNKKGGWFSKKTKQHVLKLIVGTHLNLLFTRAKLEDVKEKIDAKAFEQQELVKFKTAHPQAAQVTLDFSRKIAPEQAIDFLNSLNSNLRKLQQDLAQHSQTHEVQTAEFIEHYLGLMQTFDEKLKTYNLTLSPKELTGIFKILGEMNADAAAI